MEDAMSMLRLLISALLAVCVLLPGCASLTSCNSAQSEIAEVTEDSNGTDAPADSNGDDAAAPVTTVTQEQFEAAVSFDGVKSMTVKMEQIYEYGEDKGEYGTLLKFDGNKSKAVISDDTTETMYFEKNGDSSYVYVWESEECMRMTMDEESIPLIYSLDTFSQLFEDVDFDDLKYSDGVYKGLSEFDGTMQSLTLAFENGKLTRLCASFSGDDFKSEETLEFTEYGTTTVDLPTDFVDGELDNNDPTSAWSRYFEFNNVTVVENTRSIYEYTGDYEDYFDSSYMVHVKVAGDEWLYVDGDNVICYDGTATYVNGVLDAEADSLEVYFAWIDFSANEDDFTQTSPGVYEADKLVHKYGAEYTDVVIKIKDAHIEYIKYTEITVVEDDAGSLTITDTCEYSFSDWGSTSFDTDKYTSPSEWVSYFDFENVTATQSITAIVGDTTKAIDLYTTWKLDGGEWSCAKDIEHVDDTTTKRDLVYYDGEEGYVNYEKTNSVDSYLIGFDDVKTYFVSNEAAFSANADGTKFTADCIAGYYDDVEITVENGKIVKIAYTLKAGVEIEGVQCPAVFTLTFSDYGTTVPDQYKN